MRRKSYSNHIKAHRPHRESLVTGIFCAVAVGDPIRAVITVLHFETGHEIDVITTGKEVALWEIIKCKCHSVPTPNNPMAVIYQHKAIHNSSWPVQGNGRHFGLSSGGGSLLRRHSLGSSRNPHAWGLPDGNCVTSQMNVCVGGYGGGGERDGGWECGVILFMNSARQCLG